MTITIKYTILAYVPGEDDEERMWIGDDAIEADRQRARMIDRWPQYPVRFTTDVYYDPAPSKTADARAAGV